MADFWYLSRRFELDKKFGKAIGLLGDFVKDFPLNDPTSDPNIGGTVTSTVTGDVKMGDKSKSATTILQALKNDIHSNVKFPSVFLSLNANRILANGPCDVRTLEETRVSYP